MVAPAAYSAPIMYFASLKGPIEITAIAPPGTGFAEVDFDIVAHTMRVQVSFSDLAAPTTASHIHSATALPGTGTAGIATTVPTFPSFPLSVKSGKYDGFFDLTMASSFNPEYITTNGGTVAGAEAALAAGLKEGKAYLNIDTTAFPDGEIRGFLTRAVPEPSSIGLLAVGALAVVFASRRARR
jgi:hypothetical protein